VTDFAAGSPEMELYHVGYVVDDIEEAMRTYGSALGLTWAAVTPRPVRVQVDDEPEPREILLLATYSRQGPPYIELIQEVDGDVWSSAGPRLDHVGYWIPDLRDAMEHAVATGLDRRVCAVDEHGDSTRFCYVRSSTSAGPWVELVDASVRPGLLEWVAGGDYVVG